MAVLDELALYLQTQGLGTPGTDLFESEMPDSGPSTALALFRYQGDPPEMSHDQAGPDLELHRVQLLARSPDFAAAESLCENAYQALIRIRNAFLPDQGAVHRWLYLEVDVINAPGQIGRDAARRYHVACNLRVHRSPSPVS